MRREPDCRRAREARLACIAAHGRQVPPKHLARGRASPPPATRVAQAAEAQKHVSRGWDTLHRVLVEYALSYFNTARPHQGIGQRIPIPRERVRTRFAGSVTALPVLGGLHHDYRTAA